MSIIGILKIMEVQEDDMEVQEEAVQLGIQRWKGKFIVTRYLLEPGV